MYKPQPGDIFLWKTSFKEYFDDFFQKNNTATAFLNHFNYATDAVSYKELADNVNNPYFLLELLHLMAEGNEKGEIMYHAEVVAEVLGENKVILLRAGFGGLDLVERTIKDNQAVYRPKAFIGEDFKETVAEFMKLKKEQNANHYSYKGYMNFLFTKLYNKIAKEFKADDQLNFIFENEPATFCSESAIETLQLYGKKKKIPNLVSLEAYSFPPSLFPTHPQFDLVKDFD